MRLVAFRKRLYVVIMKGVNIHYGIVETNARGFADVLRLKMPLTVSFFGTLFDCYLIFVKYLFTDAVVFNGIRMRLLHVLCTVLLTGVAALWMKNQKRKEIFFRCLWLILAPLAFCFYRIVSYLPETVPWTYLHSMVLVWILFLTIMDRVTAQHKEMTLAGTICLALIVGRQIYICNVNYSSLQERVQKTNAMAELLFADMQETEGWTPEKPVMFTGSMEEIYSDGNWYYAETLHGWQPQVNEFLPYPGMPQNWVCAINRQYGINLQMIDSTKEEFNEIQTSTSYAEMGIWPDKNGMKMISDVLVVRLGEKE